MPTKLESSCFIYRVLKKLARVTITVWGSVLFMKHRDHDWLAQKKRALWSHEHLNAKKEEKENFIERL
jgi:hypothetical protein